MKRVNNLFSKVISEDVIESAINEVCRTHRWHHYPDKPNRKTLWIMSTKQERIKELQQMLIDGFKPSPVKKKQRYDRSAGKWREISEPALWPDQCVHHVIISVLEPVMMRGMDRWCCGSIKGRGTYYGVQAMKKWMKRGGGTKYCVEMDIYHFYDSLKPDMVMNRLRDLVKDYKMLDLVWRVIQDGIQIGSYCSQWFVNTFLQPLDHLIRNNQVSHYVRYMDNFTILTGNKRVAHRLVKIVNDWLLQHGLKLKDNWQVFRTSARLPNAMGYRFGRGYTLMRKKNLFYLKKQLRKFYRLRDHNKKVPVKLAQSLLSRLGMLRHCNSLSLYYKFVRNKTQKHLKCIIREYYKREIEKWNMYLEQYAAMGV